MKFNNRKILSKLLIILTLVALLLSSSYFAKQNKLTRKELNTLKQSYKYTNGTDDLRWATPNQYISDLLLSPSLLKLVTINNYHVDNYQCIESVGNTTRDSIKQLTLGEKTLERGLNDIENHIYTTPLVDQRGDSLHPIKSSYDIEYSSICRITESEYVVIYLTTNQHNVGITNLVSNVKAGGGWLGDSHMAVITKKDTKIFERFPFTAKLINLPRHPNGAEKSADLWHIIGVVIWS
ncbi:MAG: hypothetical protein V1487_01100 [bacterium]